MIGHYRSFLLALVLVLTLAAPLAYAQNPFQKGLETAKNTAETGGLSTKEDVTPVITNVILWILRLSALLAIGAIVWGGVTYITSLGNESKAEKAKDIIKYAIIGVIVILLSYTIINFIQERLGGPGGAYLNVHTAYAQEDGFRQGLDEFEPKAGEAGLSTRNNVLESITAIIEWLLALSAVLAMGAFVWGGIVYITSLGDEGKAEKGKNIIKFAIIGVIVVLLSFVIVKFIQQQVGTPAAGAFSIPMVYAQEDPPPPAPGSGKGFNLGISTIWNQIEPATSGLATDPDITKFILRIVNFLLSLVAVLALAALVWGAIMYIISLGDEGKAEKAKDIIKYAIIGVLVAGISFLILTVLQNFLTA